MTDIWVFTADVPLHRSTEKGRSGKKSGFHSQHFQHTADIPLFTAHFFMRTIDIPRYQLLAMGTQGRHQWVYVLHRHVLVTAEPNGGARLISMGGHGRHLLDKLSEQVV